LLFGALHQPGIADDIADHQGGHSALHRRNSIRERPIVCSTQQPVPSRPRRSESIAHCEVGRIGKRAMRRSRGDRHTLKR
jgi:hypothetical protein